MRNSRRRPIVLALVAVAAVWLVAWSGYHLAHSARMTAEKVQAYLHSVDLSRLTGDVRAKALQELAAKLNALPAEERRKARLDRDWKRWFAQMTEQEKSSFLDATLPTGIKQMLNAFEQMPPDKRRRTIDLAFKRLQQADERPDGGGPGSDSPLMDNEKLRQQAITLGLKTYYSQSSAETKAELAPLLEEIQRVMERGSGFHSDHQPNG